MNELIESILANFTVDGVVIPVSFMFYEGHGEPYITYMQQDANNSLSGDDELIGYVDYYDFDVYSTGNFLNIIESLKDVLENNGFVWQPSRSSQDFFETDTGYYHKTLNFAIFKEEN
jgi:hypothetical protein